MSLGFLKGFPYDERVKIYVHCLAKMIQKNSRRIECSFAAKIRLFFNFEDNLESNLIWNFVLVILDHVVSSGSEAQERLSDDANHVLGCSMVGNVWLEPMPDKNKFKVRFQCGLKSIKITI